MLKTFLDSFYPDLIYIESVKYIFYI